MLIDNIRLKLFKSKFENVILLISKAETFKVYLLESNSIEVEVIQTFLFLLKPKIPNNQNFLDF